MVSAATVSLGAHGKREEEPHRRHRWRGGPRLTYGEDGALQRCWAAAAGCGWCAELQGWREGMRGCVPEPRVMREGQHAVLVADSASRQPMRYACRLQVAVQAGSGAAQHLPGQGFGVVEPAGGAG